MNSFKIILLFLALVFLGCSKKNPDSSAGTIYLSATVDGEVKNYEVITGGYNRKVGIVSFHSRAGSAGNMHGFDITIFPFKDQPGTFNVAEPNLMGVCLYRTTDSQPEKNIYSSAANKGSGKVTVTAYANGIITGTFEFKGANENGEVKTVSAGKFQVKLEYLQ